MTQDCCKGGCGSEGGGCGSCSDEQEPGCCSNKSDAECGAHSCGCCGPVQEVDVSTLGPEAVELAKKFDQVNDNLVNALKLRKEIMELIYTKSAESPEMKAKIDKVLSSRHPVLMQFVFGQ